MTDTPLVRINNATEMLIKKHGLAQSANLLEALSLEKKINAHTFNVDLKDAIIKKTVLVFKINNKLLSTANTEHYKHARKCCFYLLKTHCSMSLAAIKSEFKKYPKSRNSIGAQIKSMQNVIDVPQINKELHQKYILIHNYIEKLKTKNHG